MRERPLSALFDVTALPGVMAAEPYRSVPVDIRHGHVERRIAITGKPPAADLSRVLGEGFAPVLLPESGIALSDALARILNAKAGDLVEVELLERDRRTGAAAGDRNHPRLSRADGLYVAAGGQPAAARRPARSAACICFTTPTGRMNCSAG